MAIAWIQVMALTAEKVAEVLKLLFHGIIVVLEDPTKECGVSGLFWGFMFQNSSSAL